MIATTHNREARNYPQTCLVKQSIVIADHATSVTLEPEYWDALQEIAIIEGKSVAALIRQIGESLTLSQRRYLSSAVYAFVLKWVQEAAAAKQRVAKPLPQGNSLER